jgi:hypothetical protein
MKRMSMKNAGLAILSMIFLGWLFFIWAPMVRRDQYSSEKSEELIRDTKSSYEKIRQELDQIQKTPLPQIPQVPQVPDGNGEIL